MLAVKFILPFVYCALCIVYPVYTWHLSYFKLIITMFVIPSIILFLYNFNWMQKRHWMRPFLYANIVAFIACFYFEYVALGMEIWGFSDASNYLPKRFWIMDAPLEEFLFYFGATPFCILLYTYYYRLLKDRGIADQAFPIISAWGIIVAVPFIVLSIKFFKMLWKWNTISIPSMLITIVLFFFTMGMIEYFAIANQYWIYNYDRLWGPKLFNIPIEEYLIYYNLGVVFTILLNHLAQLGPDFSLKGPATDSRPTTSPAVRIVRGSGIC